MITPPFYPIIYVRGYAGTQGEVEDTVATPYMGFNLGSTKTRQLHSGEMIPHVFESPLIRLMKDHKYHDAYHDGQIKPEGSIPPNSIWIFRYYDITSKEMKSEERSEDTEPGKREEIEFHAKALRRFIIHVREAVLEPSEDISKFRVYLVAHSMGGLICRCYLQNPLIPDLPNLDKKKVAEFNGHKTLIRKGVDKLFTYATPHGGIEFRNGLGWAEGLRDFLDINNQANFGDKRMRAFLGLKPGEKHLNTLNGKYPTERVFSLVGTDSRDYGAAGGMARRSVGSASDGLVQIKNASVLGSSRAFVHRSHSGHFGIVNSEAGYQNLRRFLFGKIRAHVEMVVDKINLPHELDKKIKLGDIEEKNIKASFYVETVFNMRGVPIELNRRTSDEESAIRRPYEIFKNKSTPLFTAFLLHSEQKKRKPGSLGYSLRIQIRVPEYEVENWNPFDDYEGGLLFSDKLNVEYHYEENREDEVDNFKNMLEAKSITYGWDREGPIKQNPPLKLKRRMGDWSLKFHLNN
ncbi:MAG: hypothetical protein IIA63_07860 [Nitrospinae bacterium]|nr:hypothetical protein [Nitrospinota bacterium]